jgi:hypothetical protein
VGFLDRVNKIWSGSDFWDKKENAKQRAEFAAQDEERKRREAEARAQTQKKQQTPRQQQSVNVSVSDVPRKPTSVTVDNTPQQKQPSVQVYKPVSQPTVTVERPTPEQVARDKKLSELNRLKDQHMANAIKEEKSRTSWFDRQFTDRKWDKRAEATAINRATRDYQDKNGWNADSDVINYQRGAGRKLDQAQENSTSQWVAPVISTARVGTGIVQGASGLYDLVTPGEGTNRLSKAADKKAVEQDQLAKDMGIEKAYKVGNVAGEIASYLIPGMVATKAAKGLNTAGKVGNMTARYGQFVDDIGRLIDQGGDANKIRQFVANRVRQNFTPEEIMQELMITGRYMGQNTARGGDTSPQSVATDALMGLAGGLLVPADGLNKLLRRADGTALAADDAVGAGIAGGADYIDNAMRQADIPQVKPEVPEVAPGVKSPNLVNNPAPEIPTGAVDVPNPTNQVAPPSSPVTVPQNPAPYVPPTQPVTAGPQPVVNPGVVEIPSYQALDVPTKPPQVVETPPPVQQIVPETAPVSNPIETPNVAQSRAVAQATPVSVPEEVITPPPAPVRSVADEGVDGLRNRREQLIAERDALAADGMSAEARAVDEQIRALDQAISSKVAVPTDESRVLAEGDRQLAEAIQKPTISKQEVPRKPSEKGVTTRQMSPEEMKAAGMSDEAIANVMAKRGEVEAPEVTKPEKTNVAQSTTTPVNKMTQAEKNQVEIDRANAVRKAEGSELLPPAPKVEKPSKAELQKGAQDNTTKSGKVSQKWVKAQREAGADPVELRSAIEKVEGMKAPSKPPKEMAGGIASAGTQGVSVSGDVIEQTSKKAAEALGKSEANATTVSKFIDDMKAKEKAGGGFDQKNAETALELQKKVEQGTEEWHDLGDIYRKSGTQAAQTMATRAKTIRDNGTEEEIVAHYINRLRDKTGLRITKDDVADINRKVTEEVRTRSEFNKAQEAYFADTTDPAKQKAAIEAARARDVARKEAMIEEMRTTVNVSGGDRKTKKELIKLIDQLNKDADVWQMDMIDTSLLSTSGTWIANAVNSSFGAIEESLFGKLGAKIARARTGTDIGGGNAYKLKSQKFGVSKLVQEAKNRTLLPHKNKAGGVLNTLKNIVTTMNEIGNTQIDAGAHTSVSAEYRRILQREYPDKFGKKMSAEAKKELDDLVEYHALVDPRDLKQKYIDYGFKVQGMAAVLGKAGKSRVAKVENQMADAISNMLRAGDKNPMPKPLADGIGKLTMRVTIGFPTIVARSAGQGIRRLSGGTPTFLQAAFTEDPVQKAMLIKQGVKEFGSGVALVSAGIAAGQSGIITGAYPTDKTTQDEWAKEGKSEWSIKIGDDYYGIPRLLGPFAIPFLAGAQFGDTSNDGEGGFFNGNIKGMADSIAKSVDATMPVGQISDNLNTITDLAGLFSENEGEREKAEKALVKFGGNAARIGLIPLSGMLNQIAQSTTGTQKDTSQWDNPVEGILLKVLSGVPAVNHNLPDKTSKDGTVLKNTDPLARALGASSTENAEGVADNKKQIEDNQNDLAPIIKDKNIYDLLEPETQKLLDKTQDPKSKKRLNDQNFETIYKDVAKTTDKLASEGKWDSYGSTLKVKLATQKADKKSTPDEQAMTERKIKQADILSSNKIDKRIFALYDLSAEKGGVSASDFKKMIDPEDEYYDFETASKLWDLDKLFTDAGVSGNNTGAIDPWTRQKYSMPKDKKGSGGGSGSKEKGITTDFGTVGSFGKPSGGDPTQKYKQLTNTESPLANLTSVSSKTKLRKNISVAKGVRL